MKLLLDCGNSRTKWALAKKHVLVDSGVAEGAVIPASLKVQPLESILLASVRQDAVYTGLLASARQLAPVKVLRTPAEHNGLHCAYAEPARLGVDRWLAMLGAWSQQGQGFTLVDAGTAVTIDLVSDTGHHLGGAILPGDQFMVESLVSRTSGIRPRPDDAAPLYPARDTGAAVRAGARMAALGAVKEALQAASALNETGPLLLTGGAADWLATALADYHPQLSHQLVFEGMLEMDSC